MADDSATIDPAAEGELSIEEFVARGNARDRGEDVEPIATPPTPPVPPPAAADATPAAEPKARFSPGKRRESIQAQIDALTTTKHQTLKEIETAQAQLTDLRRQLREQQAAPPPPPPQPQAPPPAPVPPPPQAPRY